MPIHCSLEFKIKEGPSRPVKAGLNTLRFAFEKIILDCCETIAYGSNTNVNLKKNRLMTIPN